MLYYLHDGSEGYKLASKQVVASFLQYWRVFVDVSLVVLQRICKELYGVGETIFLILFQQPAEPEIVEQACIHDSGYLVFFHPLHPSVVDGMRNHCGNVKYDHSLKILISGLIAGILDSGPSVIHQGIF